MKRWIGATLAVCLMLSMTGCKVIDAISDIINSEQAIAEEEAIPRIGFAKGVLFEDEKEVIYKADEFAEKESEFSAWRGTLHFDALTENEQTVYRALEFAMENGYNNILVDDLLVDEQDDLMRVLEFLSLDSPMLEQNLRTDFGEFTTYYTVSIGGLYDQSATFDGFYIQVDNFEQKYWDLKLKAFEKAEEIADRYNRPMSDIAKAENLFRYLAASCKYRDYRNDEAVQTYLYDALLQGESNCDGYANALSLLFRLAGINCVEKFVLETGEDSGHTWNFAEIDGTWYNFDCTSGNQHVPLVSTTLHAGRYFAFSDQLQKHYPDYREVYPASENNFYISVDAHLSSESHARYRTSVTAGLRSHDGKWAAILLDSLNETKLRSQMKKVANDLNGTVYWVTYSLVDGRSLLLIHRGDLFD